jgi:diadenosine tetraphosphate (Ap4A) HIT family hydrolase
MQTNILFENNYIKVELEPHEIPWLKIFSQSPFKEFSQCDIDTKSDILRALDIIEKEMLEYFQPDKINIASFGNYVPHVHFHIQARFKEDSYFPEPTWGKKQRDGQANIKNMEAFLDSIKLKLK